MTAWFIDIFRSIWRDTLKNIQAEQVCQMAEIYSYVDGKCKHYTHTHTYIYIYILYIYIERESEMRERERDTVSLYHNSSMWLDA